MILWDNKDSVVIAILEREAKELQKGEILVYKGLNKMINNIVIFYGKDREDVVRQATKAGLSIEEKETYD